MQPGNKLKDKAATGIFWFVGILILAVIAWFLYEILAKGIGYVTPKFISSMPLEMEEGGGVGPQIFNTFYILVLSLVFCVPVGIGAGIYLGEFAKENKLTKLIRLSVECLASVPSIIFGLFGVIIFVVKFGWGFSILGGAVALAILNLPIVIRVTEEAIRAVPETYREASFSLGTTHWQTVWSIVLPSALPRLLVGINLVIGRAIGESAVLIYTAGTGVGSKIVDLNPLAAGGTLSVHLWYVKSVGIAPDADAIAAGTAALLIIIVLMFNIIIGLLSNVIRKKFEGV